MSSRTIGHASCIALIIAFGRKHEVQTKCNLSFAKELFYLIQLISLLESSGFQVSQYLLPAFAVLNIIPSNSLALTRQTC